MTRRARILALVALPMLILLTETAWSPGAARAQAEEEPFDQAQIFFEFNSTDNDLGVQVKLDGEAWKRLRIFGPGDRRLLNLNLEGRLAKLGLTELFFESDEPSPEEVLDLLQEGEYEFEGLTVDGEALESESTLSHDLPPAPNILVPSVAGEELDPLNAVVEWAAIAGIASWEIIVENEDAGAEMTVPLSAGVTSLHIPQEFLDPDTEYKVEVLAIGTNGNKTISERVFVTGS
ncbi:MAG: hypothetical protein ACREAA_07740 [Candidatus Polarisedimenticolia bacterium]